MLTGRANAALRIAAPSIFLAVVVLAAVSLVEGWPHQFGGQGSRPNIWVDFVFSGTATAPPLFILVIFGVVAFAGARRDSWGTVALVVLVFLAVLMAVASLGEALAVPTPDVPRPVQYFSGSFGGIAGFTLFVLGSAALVERWRSASAFNSAEQRPG